MRASLLICLVLLILIHEAEGFHIKEASLYEIRQSKLNVHSRKLVEPPNSAQYTQKEQSSGNSIIRKLLHAKTTSGTNSKKIEKEGDTVEFESSRETLLKRKEEKVTKNEESRNPPPYHHYPDLLDMAGMDYSPASRRPPIHN